MAPSILMRPQITRSSSLAKPLQIMIACLFCCLMTFFGKPILRMHTLVFLFCGAFFFTLQYKGACLSPSSFLWCQSMMLSVWGDVLTTGLICSLLSCRLSIAQNFFHSDCGPRFFIKQNWQPHCHVVGWRIYILIIRLLENVFRSILVTLMVKQIDMLAALDVVHKPLQVVQKIVAVQSGVCLQHPVDEQN